MHCTRWALSWECVAQKLMHGHVTWIRVPYWLHPWTRFIMALNPFCDKTIHLPSWLSIHISFLTPSLHLLLFLLLLPFHVLKLWIPLQLIKDGGDELPSKQGEGVYGLWDGYRSVARRLSWNKIMQVRLKALLNNVFTFKNLSCMALHATVQAKRNALTNWAI